MAVGVSSRCPRGLRGDNIVPDRSGSTCRIRKRRPDLPPARLPWRKPRPKWSGWSASSRRRRLLRGCQGLRGSGDPFWVSAAGPGRSPGSREAPQPTGGHISTEPRINDRIRVPEVRLVGPAGAQVGIVKIDTALQLARESELDLVEVAPMARPPVAKLMDYGKFKYENAQKARESRRNQTNTVIKEMKLRPKIDSHDYETKKGHVVRFLKAGDKVKITIMFRGREQSRPELGYNLLKKLAAEVDEFGFVESSPKQDGRNMLMVLGPHKKKTEARAEVRAERDRRAAERQGGSGG